MLEFEALGLRWRARADFTPGDPGGLYEPATPPEVEIRELHNWLGDECGWVLELDEVRERIEAALLERATRGGMRDEP